MPVTLELTLQNSATCPLSKYNQQHNGVTHAWNYQLNGLSPELREEFINKMPGFKWHLLPRLDTAAATTTAADAGTGTEAAGVQPQSLFFCICDTCRAEVCPFSKLTMDFLDCSKYPMEFATQISNALDAIGYGKILAKIEHMSM